MSANYVDELPLMAVTVDDSEVSAFSWFTRRFFLVTVSPLRNFLSPMTMRKNRFTQSVFHQQEKRAKSSPRTKTTYFSICKAYTLGAWFALLRKQVEARALQHTVSSAACGSFLLYLLRFLLAPPCPKLSIFQIFVLFPVTSKGNNAENIIGGSSEDSTAKSDATMTDVLPPPNIVRLTPKAKLATEYRLRFFCDFLRDEGDIAVAATAGPGSPAVDTATATTTAAGIAKEETLVVLQETALQNRVREERKRLATQVWRLLRSCAPRSSYFVPQHSSCSSSRLQVIYAQWTSCKTRHEKGWSPMARLGAQASRCAVPR